MNFSDIVEASIDREARQIAKVLSKRTVELHNQINKYSKSIKKMKDDRERLKKQLSSAKPKKAAKLTGEIAGLSAAISDLENKKNKVIGTLEKYKKRIMQVPKPEASFKAPEPKDIKKAPMTIGAPMVKHVPRRYTIAGKSAIATKQDLRQLFNKMEREITRKLKSYIDSKVKEEPEEAKKEVEKKIENEVEKAKNEMPEIQPKVSTPTKKTHAYREVERALITSAEAPFKSEPLKSKVRNALNLAFKEDPEADYDALLSRIDELIPDFTVQ